MPLGCGARYLAMHVGNGVAIDELKGSVLLEEGDHRAAVVEERVDP